MKLNNDCSYCSSVPGFSKGGQRSWAPLRPMRAFQNSHSLMVNRMYVKLIYLLSSPLDLESFAAPSFSSFFLGNEVLKMTNSWISMSSSMLARKARVRTKWSFPFIRLYLLVKLIMSDADPDGASSVVAILLTTDPTKSTIHFWRNSWGSATLSQYTSARFRTEGK